MKIIYYSKSFFADCDFPLVRELQKKGHDVTYYIPMASFCLRSTLFDIKKLYPHTGIFPSSIYPELNMYRDYVDLSKVFIVNQYYKQKYHPFNLFLYLKLVIHFILKHPDVIHITLPPELTFKLIYLVRKKLVLTVHDPFEHSGRKSMRNERNRRLAFSNIDKLVLLNRRQVDDFIISYNIPKSKVFVNKLGVYDSIVYVNPIFPIIKSPFILFWGLIADYKGIEFLMQAMVEIHNNFPDLKLVIAGGGKIYFDVKPYKNLDYILLKNQYLGQAELSGYLRKCLFVVCPYKNATQSGVVQTAYSLHVPVIATNVGALPEVVIHNKTGLIVPPCDASALVEAIQKLVSHPQLVSTMRNNIKDYWEKDMAWDKIADDYINCYQS